MTHVLTLSISTLSIGVRNRYYRTGLAFNEKSS